MTRFLLIRHGETDIVGKRLAGRMPGVRLNATGREQADKLPGRLEGTPIEVLYSSPLERARETAQPLGTYRNLPVQLSEASAEFDYGEWTGRSFADLEGDAQWRLFNSNRSLFGVPGGETMLGAQTRAVTELERLRTQHEGVTVALVAHAEWIRCAVMFYLGIPLDFFGRVEIAPASVSTVDVAEWGAVVKGLNWI